MPENYYVQYDLIEVDGNRRHTCWLSNASLKVGDRVTLKDHVFEIDPYTEESKKVWWQVIKKYSGIAKTKEEIEMNRLSESDYYLSNNIGY